MAHRAVWRAVLCAGLLAVWGASALAQSGDDRPKPKSVRKDIRPADRAQEGSLKEGDAAPDFKLKSLDGNSEVRLASFRGRQPVVLIFGSYT
jgi:peroxiredoxin